MEGKVVFIRQYGTADRHKWGIKCDGWDKLLYSFDDCSGIEKGDTMFYTIEKKGQYENIVLGSDEAPVGTVAHKEEFRVSTNRNISIEAQVCLKSAIELVCARIKTDKVEPEQIAESLEQYAIDSAVALKRAGDELEKIDMLNSTEAAF